MPSFGPHGLAIQSYGSFAGKVSATKTVGDQMPARLGPHVLPKSPFNTPTLVEITLTGATGTGETGNVAPVTPGASTQLGPHGLPSKDRIFEIKGVGLIELTLTGAEGRGQAEELEGSDVAITLDGGVGFGLGGIIPFPEPPSPTGGYLSESMYNSEAQRRKRRKERIRELQEEIRRINRWR